MIVPSQRRMERRKATMVPAVIAICVSLRVITHSLRQPFRRTHFQPSNPDGLFGRPTVGTFATSPSIQVQDLVDLR